MVNRIRTIYPCGLNEGFSSRFCVGSWVGHETPECNNEDEDNSPNILSNKNWLERIKTIDDDDDNSWFEFSFPSPWLVGILKLTSLERKDEFMPFFMTLV